jgi:hypothetical protein
MDVMRQKACHMKRHLIDLIIFIPPRKQRQPRKFIYSKYGIKHAGHFHPTSTGNNHTESMRTISIFAVLATSVFAIPNQSPAILLNGVTSPPPEPVCPRTFPCYGIVGSYPFVHQSDQFDRSGQYVLPGRVSSATTYLR